MQRVLWEEGWETLVVWERDVRSGKYMQRLHAFKKVSAEQVYGLILGVSRPVTGTTLGAVVLEVLLQP